jgi:hypothetical protein
MIRATLLALLALAASAQPAAGGGDDGDGDGDEIRALGTCAAGARATLRLKRDDGEIEVRFELRHARGGAWRVTLVHERRVVWKGTARARAGRSFELRRTLPDLAGSDTVTVQAWGPRGAVCRATGTLAEP